MSSQDCLNHFYRCKFCRTLHVAPFKQRDWKCLRCITRAFLTWVWTDKVHPEQAVETLIITSGDGHHSGEQVDWPGRR